MRFWLNASILLIILVALSGIVSASSELAAGDDLYWQRLEPGIIEQAVEQYKQAVDSGESYEAYWRLARAYEWWGMHASSDNESLFEEGKQYAEKAVELNPDGVDAHYWLGVLIGRVGESRGILNSLFMVKPMAAEMERVLELEPNHPGAHHVLSVLYRKVPGWPLSIGDKDKAVEFAQRAVELKPESTQYHLGLAEALLANKKKNEATAELEKVVGMADTPGDPAESAESKATARAILAEIAEK